MMADGIDDGEKKNLEIMKREKEAD